MQTIEVSAEEVKTGIMSPENLAEAVEAIESDGFVVLGGVISSESIITLRDKMREDLARFIARDDAPFNFNQGNIQQDPPPFPPFLFQDVLLNKMVIAVTRAVLGQGVKNDFYSGNTAIKSEQRQPVHADSGQLFANLVEGTPPYGLVVNVPLVDFSPQNGSTEIWAGTHKDTSVVMGQDIKVTPEMLEKWREKSQPFQPTIKAGSVLIRDIRLWHAGMPNRTDTPRTMIAMLHYIGWWKTGTLKFPKGTEAFFADSELHTCAQFVEGDIDYVHAPGAYEYVKEAAPKIPAETF